MVFLFILSPALVCAGSDSVVFIMFGKRKTETKSYDRENLRPVLKCSICNGEQVAGFKDIRTGKFQEIMLIRDEAELALFMKMYDIDTIPKEY